MPFGKHTASHSLNRTKLCHGASQQIVVSEIDPDASERGLRRICSQGLVDCVTERRLEGGNHLQVHPPLPVGPEEFLGQPDNHGLYSHQNHSFLETHTPITVSFRKVGVPSYESDAELLEHLLRHGVGGSIPHAPTIKIKRPSIPLAPVTPTSSLAGQPSDPADRVGTGTLCNEPAGLARHLRLVCRAKANASCYFRPVRRAKAIGQ